MASKTYIESLVCSAKRLKISSPCTTSHRALHRLTAAKHQQCTSLQTIRTATQLAPAASKAERADMQDIRLPKAVQAVFLAPLKRAPTHGIPVCDLQIRSYSVRNLEAFTDFCMRAAYYLNLPAKGPVPLPRITERWTVPRSNFVHKKSQENFERITVRRLVQIQDGHPETVALWLAYIQKHRYYGVGMKANVFEHGALDTVQEMDKSGESAQETLSEQWGKLEKSERSMSDERYTSTMFDEPFKAQWGAFGGMVGMANAPTGRQRFRRNILGASRRKTAQKAAAAAYSDKNSS